MNSDSSASTTPMILTPDSTGTTSSSPESIAAAAGKKTRRQTAFYPNVNSSNKLQKPFSRSAAKRESVMMLGSIEHLQHYFTKTGIAAKRNPLGKAYHGLVPAIGGLTHIRTSPSIGSQFELPPSPAVPPPQTVAFPPHVKVSDIDPESLLPGVVEDLAAVAHAWSIDSTSTITTQLQGDPREMSGSSSERSFDVLAVLKITTRTVRSIRNYLLSLPDESAGTIRAHFRPKLLGPGKASSSSSTASLAVAAVPDPLTLIRKSAIEVLTVLRELEERYRLPLSDDVYDAHSEAGGARGGGPDPHSRVASPSANSDAELHQDEVELELPGHPLEADTSVTFSLVQVQGRMQTVPVWEDSEDEFAPPDEEEERERKRREHWDERLVIGSGWLYRQDVTLVELEKERRVVGEYLDVVDEVLFEWKRDGKVKERGWERERRKALEKGDRGVSRAKARRVSAIDARERDRGTGLGMGMLLDVAESGRRRVSTGMLNSTMGSMTLSEEPESVEDINKDDEEASVDDEELPVWAQRSSFIDDDLGRAHALLSTFLPSHLLSTLDPPSISRTAFLTSLSSGQLLCVAYNACVRKSKHPWGYVSREGIHDILALEKAERDAGADKDEKAPEGGKKGWTFRRTDNLRLWAGALKLRYMLPLAVPSQTLVQGPIGIPGMTAMTASMSGGGTGAPGLGTPVGSPVRASHRSTEPVIIFDAKIVAKKEIGWEDMLQAVILKWVAKAVEEKRLH